MWPVRGILSLAVVHLVVLPAAWAADPPSEQPVTPAPEELFQRAGEAFAAKQFAQALELLERACGQSDFEGCDFNLGAVHHALRHCDEARAHYGAYLKAHSGGARAGEARAALEALEPRCGADESAVGNSAPVPKAPLVTQPAAPRSADAASAAPEPAPAARALPPSSVTAEPGPAPPDGPRRIVAASLLGLGGTAGVATLLFALRLSSVNADVEA
jgi:hypothetical protein